MTGFWSVILPETANTTNLITRPSAESTDITGWAAVAGTLTRSTSKSRRGYASLYDIPSTGTYDGIYFDSVALTIGSAYAFSADVWAPDGIPYRLYFADTAGTIAGAATTFTGNAAWQRQACLYTSTASANFRLYVTKNNNTSSDSFYIDGAQCIASSYDQTYIDGDQDDCVWNGTAHLSTSYRKANSRAGGRVYNFDDLSFYLAEWPGAGMAEITPYSSSYGLLPGSFDQGEKITERKFTLVGTLIGTSWTNLHYARQQVINALKSDRVKDNQQVILQYTGANSLRPVRISAKYTRGLQGAKTEGYTEKLGLDFLATDPYWYEDGEEGAELTLYGTDSDANGVAKRVSGIWSAMNSGFNNGAGFNCQIHGFAVDKAKNIYVCGSFDNLGSTDGSGVIKFSGISSTSPIALGTGCSTAETVYDIACAPNSDLYAVGDFNSMGGVVNTGGIARWDGSAWNACSTGFASSDDAHAISIGQDGSVYIGGVFYNITDTNGNFITKFDGSSFSSLGTGVGGGVVEDIIGDFSGNIYIIGDFTTAGGIAANHVAKWDGSAWSALGTGLSGGSPTAGNCLAVDKSGNIYAGGTFASAGGTPANNIARWNGESWFPLGNGRPGSVESISIDDNGYIYCCGSSGTGIRQLSVWNGSTWSNVEISHGYTSYKIMAVGNDLLVGYGSLGTLTSAYQNALTNSGTARAFPRFVFARSDTSPTDTATVEYIQNETTGATLWIDYDLLPGETLTIDTALTKRKVESSYFGNVIGRALLRGSDFADFCLLPGANSISVFVNLSGSATCTGYATWPIAHWSNDGAST